MNREYYLENIINLLDVLERNIYKRGSLNLRDINFHCENFYRDFLSMVYDLKIDNSNYQKNNHDTIDLFDSTSRKSYQVTSTTSRAKVNKTIKGFEKYLTDFDEIYIVFIIPKDGLKKSNGKITPFNSKFKFSVDEHLLDNRDILREIQNLKIEKIKNIYNLLKEELDPLSRKETNQETINFTQCLNTWTSFLHNSSINIHGKEFKSYSITQGLCEEIFSILSSEMHHFGRMQLFNNYDFIDKAQYYKLFGAIKNRNLDDIKKTDENIEIFINDMRLRNEEDRWEYLKYYIGSRDFETPEVKSALESIGLVSFYKVEFSTRQFYYNLAIEKISHKYANFVDRYLGCIQEICDVISKSSNPNEFSKLLNTHLYKHDYLFILYFLWGEKYMNSAKSIAKFIEFEKIISEGVSIFMIDLPSDNVIKKEIELASVFEKVK